MADMEFDLGEALGGYEQAQADRNFYLSMVQGGTQSASPIAAYLAGVSGVKMANMRQQAQDVQDARQAKLDATAAADKAQKRRDALQSQLLTIVKGVNDGTIPASVGATMVGPIGKELGINVKQYDAENGTLVYNEGNDPTDYEWDWRESPTSKLQQNYYKTQEQLALQKQREDRLSKESESRVRLNEEKLNALAKGKSSSNSSSAELRFINENKDLFDNVFNPKSVMIKRQPLSQRLDNYTGKDVSKLRKWIRGVETLPEDAQERLGEYTDLIASRLDYLQNPSGATLVAPGESNNKQTKAF